MRPETRWPFVSTDDFRIMVLLRLHRRRVGQGRAAGPIAARQGQERWQQEGQSEAQCLVFLFLFGYAPQRLCHRRGRAEEDQGGQGARAQSEAACGGRRGGGLIGGLVFCAGGTARTGGLIGGLVFCSGGTARTGGLAPGPTTRGVENSVCSLALTNTILLHL